MQVLKLITLFILLPILATAEEASNAGYAYDILQEGSIILKKALNYKLFSLDNQSITLKNIIIAIIALIFGLRLARYLSTEFKNKLFSIIDIDNNSANLIGRIIDYLFVTIIIIIVLDIARVPITIFTFIGGAFVISIGLSSQHLLNNFISGIAMIIESNLKVGDLIEFEGIIGRISKIEARMIQLRTQDNLEYFIPHSKLMQDRFSNWSYNGNRIRISTSLKIDQKDIINSDFEHIIFNTIIQHRDILTTPKPQILLLSFEENILCYEINFWINLSNSDRRNVISEVNYQILNALKVHNIPLATPRRIVTS